MSAAKGGRRVAKSADGKSMPSHTEIHGNAFLSPPQVEPPAARRVKESPYSLKGIVIDVCRRQGFDPAEVMRPYPPATASEPVEVKGQDGLLPDEHGAHRAHSGHPRIDPAPSAPRPSSNDERRLMPVDRSGAAAMARAVCSMDDDTFWIVYLALSVEYERRFGEAGLARKVAGYHSSRPAGEVNG